jgi:hypothetical protein
MYSCSSLAFAAAGRVNTVSQAINMVYHAPAPVYVTASGFLASHALIYYSGHHLRIVNRTMTIGSRILSARTEVSCNLVVAVHKSSSTLDMGCDRCTTMREWDPYQDGAGGVTKVVDFDILNLET